MKLKTEDSTAFGFLYMNPLQESGSNVYSMVPTIPVIEGWLPPGAHSCAY